MIYHPHTREEIPLGTIAVEKYKRPTFTFNKILYSEKEGLFPILKDVNWPERHDCALLTSKGYASYAVRDLLTLLRDTDEPLTIFCIHDAYGYGTKIFQTLQEGAKRHKGTRPIEIVNLGLDPQEAVEEMNLQIEAVVRKKSRKGKVREVATGDYLDPKWREWLQANRVELNAMETPTFLEWLNRKMKAHDGKVRPPQAELDQRFKADLAAIVRDQETARVLGEANIDGLVIGRLENMKVQVRNESRKCPPTSTSG